MMIKNIVFDMGQVLIRFSPDLFLERCGLDNPEDAKLLKREVFQSVDWAKMDRGSLREEEALEIMCTRLPERLHDYARQLVLEWNKPLIPIQGMAEVVKELKENSYGIYLLSNAAYGQKDYWPEIPGSEYFDGCIVSAYERLVKPQPEIYKLLTERFGLVPEQTVFIDDSASNCEGACFCGFNAIVFHDDAAELRTKLRQLGVNINA